MKVARSAIAKRALLVALTLVIAYLGFLSYFAITSVNLLKDARATYGIYKSDGLTNEVEKQYRDLLQRTDRLVGWSSNPLLTPIIAISGKRAEIDSALALFRYSRGFLDVAPEFAGFKGPKRYFVAFQNPAEARGTGGLVGAFAILKFDRGNIEFEKVGSNYLLALQDEMPVKLPEEFHRTYGDHPAWWVNSNMSPHFPYAAQIWMGLWKNQYRDRLDGALTLDPIVLRDVLKITGPVTVRGLTISADNVVSETLFDFYLRYRDDNEFRKEYLVEIIKAVITKAFSGNISRASLVWSIRDSILDNRVLVYSVDEKLQESIAKSPISGSLAPKKSNEFRLVLQNTAGNKMDYFIRRTLTLESKNCENRRITQATLKITNTASKNLDLPDGYYGRLDRVDKSNPDNSTSLAVFMYGPPRAKLVAASEKETGLAAGYIKKELTREALVIPLELGPGESREFIADFQGGTGPITAHVQPLVFDQDTVIIDNCRL